MYWLVFVFTAHLTEDFCGVEPVTHPPIELETRPPPLVDEEKLRKAYNQIDSAILGGLSFFLLFFGFFFFSNIKLQPSLA